MTRPLWRPHTTRERENNVAAHVDTQRAFLQQPPAPPTGPGQGFPVFAELIFHWPSSAGALASGVSDAHSARWQCSVLGLYVDVTTFSTSFDLTVYVNGVAVSGLNPVTVTGGGQEFPCNPAALLPRTDLVTVNATSPGTGNLGVVARVLTG